MGAVTGMHLGKDYAYVIADSVAAHAQSGRDLVSGFALRHQAKHGKLASSDRAALTRFFQRLPLMQRWEN